MQVDARARLSRERLSRSAVIVRLGLNVRRLERPESSGKRLAYPASLPDSPHCPHSL